MRAPRRLDPERVVEHLPRLYRAARAWTRSREDAEDLVQETYARVLARPRLIRNEDDLGYLLRALRNTFLNQKRSEGRRLQPGPLPDEPDVLADPHARRPDTALEAAELFAARPFARDGERGEARRRHARPERDVAALVERPDRDEHAGLVLEPGLVEAAVREAWETGRVELDTPAGRRLGERRLAVRTGREPGRLERCTEMRPGAARAEHRHSDRHGGDRSCGGCTHENETAGRSLCPCSLRPDARSQRRRRFNLLHGGA